MGSHEEERLKTPGPEKSEPAHEIGREIAMRASQDVLGNINMEREAILSLVLLVGKLGLSRIYSDFWKQTSKSDTDEEPF